MRMGDLFGRLDQYMLSKFYRTSMIGKLGNNKIYYFFILVGVSCEWVKEHRPEKQGHKTSKGTGLIDP